METKKIDMERIREIHELLNRPGGSDKQILEVLESRGINYVLERTKGRYLVRPTTKLLRQNYTGINIPGISAKRSEPLQISPSYGEGPLKEVAFVDSGCGCGMDPTSLDYLQIPELLKYGPVFQVISGATCHSAALSFSGISYFSSKNILNMDEVYKVDNERIPLETRVRFLTEKVLEPCREAIESTYGRFLTEEEMKSVHIIPAKD